MAPVGFHLFFLFLYEQTWWMIFSCKTYFQGCTQIIGCGKSKSSWNSVSLFPIQPALNGMLLIQSDIIIGLTLKLQTLALFQRHVTNSLWLILHLISTNAWLLLQHPWFSLSYKAVNSIRGQLQILHASSLNRIDTALSMASFIPIPLSVLT